jgi:2-(1,2-epoxy-1,2-dihydrophenyl)acetyl-CoA isomerase
VSTDRAAGPVLVEVSEGVATITLNRPEQMNALDTATKEALRDSVTALASDDAVRCVVLTGRGRAFCVGQDLREHSDQLADRSLEQVWSTVREHYAPLVATLAAMPKPVVAAVNGVAAGAGAALALAADFRILGGSAGLNFGFAGIGLACDTGTSWTLPRLVGSAKALELLLLPRTISPPEALELGLATSVVEDDTLAEKARTLATRLAQGPTVAFGAIRRAMAFSAAHPLDESLEFEAAMMQLTGGTTDHRRAVESFLAKQQPHFQGS